MSLIWFIELLVRFGVQRKTAVIIVSVAFILLVLAILISPFAIYQSCKSRNTEKKIEKLGEQILEGKINANISAVEVQEKVNITNKANSNLSNVMNRNVSQYNGNANNALKRFDCEVEKNCK